MSDRQEFSDERLNAFVDGELDAAEREEILAAVPADAALGHRLCELRATKDLVRHAYSPVPPAVRRRYRSMPCWGGALAAGLALVVGTALGWQGHRASEGDGLLAFAQKAPASQPSRVLIHLDDSTEYRMEEALDMAEAYLRKVGDARVEIVVNDDGLDLLRKESSPYAERIARLSARHELLSFVACGNAISRYRSSGKEVTLLPGAQVADTAIQHVVDRVHQGWTYVKI